MSRVEAVAVVLVALVTVVLGCAKLTGKEGENRIARIDPAKEKELRSPPDEVPVTIKVRNNTQGPVEFHWLDYNGKRVRYARIKPGAEITQKTFKGHYWIILDEKGKALGIYETPGRDGVIVVE